MTIPPLVPNSPYFRLLYEGGNYNLVIGFTGSGPDTSEINFFTRGYSEQEFKNFVKWICDTYGFMPEQTNLPRKDGDGNYLTPYRGTLTTIEPLGAIPEHLITSGYWLFIDGFRLIYAQ